MIQNNVFHKGIVTDIDYSKRTPDTWDFPTLNIRILNKEGQGYIVTNMLGNTQTQQRPEREPFDHTGWQFKISSGFAVLASCEMGGILYIASYNPITLESEIGSYPSPIDGTEDTDTETGNGFARIYKPLKNYTAAKNELRTALLGFSLAPMEMFARYSYDNSVDLFICNGVMPNKIFNSGFTQNGIRTGRVYENSDFDSTVWQIQNPSRDLLVDLVDITDSSSDGFYYGNYFFYFKYVDSSLNKTIVVADSNLVQMFDDVDMKYYSIIGGTATEKTAKKIRFNLSNVDESFTYIEVSYTRFYGTEAQTMTSETKTIDQLFPIIVDNSGNMEIILDGSATEIAINESEILDIQPSEIACKSHLQLNNRYFGANWTSFKTTDETLVDFAKAITIGYDTIEKDLTSLDGNPPLNKNVLENDEYSYSNYNNTYDYVGYFRGEPYCFMVQYEFMDGSLSDGYPMRGSDEWLDGFGDGYFDDNDLGVYRFPTNSTCFGNGVPVYKDGKINLLGVNFDLTAAKTYLSSQTEGAILTVKSIRFLRMDRIPTMLFQGLGIAQTLSYSPYYISDTENAFTREFSLQSGSYGDSSPLQGGGFVTPDGVGLGCFGSFDLAAHTWWGWIGGGSTPDITPDDQHQSDTEFCPFYRGYYPALYHDEETLNPNNYYNYTQRSLMQLGKYGIFSPDLLFEQNVEDEAPAWIIPQSVCNSWVYNGLDGSYFPLYSTFEQTNASTAGGQAMREITGSKFINSSTRSNPQVIGLNKYLHSIKDYSQDPAEAWVWKYRDSLGNVDYWTNRSAQFAPYMAVELDMEYETANDSMQDRICNVYNIDPREYSISNYASLMYSANFYPISEFISMASLPNNKLCWKGDCYINRTYFKQVGWIGTLEDNVNFDDTATGEGQVHYTHGVMIGIVTENKRNTNLRYHSTVNNHDFFPHVNSLSWPVKAMQANTAGIEGYYYNEGNNATHSNISYKAYNINAPVITNHDRTTRIRFSSLHEPYSFVDGYRKLDAESYRDFELGYGPINKISEYLSKLISIQDKSINEHYIETSNSALEENLTTVTNGDVTSLVSSPKWVLSEKSRRLSDYGTQHQWSVKSGYRGVYGVDWARRIIWRIGLSRNTDGSIYVAAESLSEAKSIEKWIYDLAKLINPNGYNDIIDLYGDNPINSTSNGGIVTGRNVKYKEMYFTFLHDNAAKTLCFSEDIDSFIGEQSFTPAAYMNLDDKLFTSREYDFTAANRHQSRYAFLHDIPDTNGNTTTFYMTKYPSQVSVVINGGQEQTAFMKKYYNVEIESLRYDYPNVTDMEFDKVEFSTLYQSSELNPFITNAQKLDDTAGDFWIAPRYIENRWRFTIPAQTSAESSEFDTESQLVGTYMKLSLTFSPNISMFVKSILVNYELSFS